MSAPLLTVGVMETALFASRNARPEPGGPPLFEVAMTVDREDGGEPLMPRQLPPGGAGLLVGEGRLDQGDGGDVEGLGRMMFHAMAMLGARRACSR